MAKVGRPKGSGNKPLKRLLAERLSEKYPDFDPVIEMIEGSIKIKEIAETTGELSDYKSAVESFDRVSKYIQPTLKATELTTDGGLTVSVQRKRFDGSSNDTNNTDWWLQTGTPPSEGGVVLYIYAPRKKKLRLYESNQDSSWHHIRATRKPW